MRSDRQCRQATKIEPSMIELRLFIGTKFTGIIVRQDAKYPTMYRIHWPDRAPSDMVNLARAKDAAMRWAGREGGTSAKGLNWRMAKTSTEPAQTP